MKVTEYEGHKVPEGATHYASESTIQRAGFYKHNKIRPFFYSVNRFGWVKSINKEIPSFAIELPEQQEDNAEWVPVVGEECEFTDDMNVFEVCIPRFLGDKTCIIDLPELGDFESYFPIKALKFRPLKTDEQKKREAFINKALEEVETKAGIIAPSKAILEILFDAGFTAPEGGE